VNGLDCFYLPAPETGIKRNAQGMSNDDFRRLLSDLKQRPISDQVLLRELLHRAMQTGATPRFPVTNHAVLTP
jgi:hypothetical protein